MIVFNLIILSTIEIKFIFIIIMFNNLFSKYSRYLIEKPFLTKTLTTSIIKSCYSSIRRYNSIVLYREKESKLIVDKMNCKIIGAWFRYCWAKYVWLVSCDVSSYVLIYYEECFAKIISKHLYDAS